MYKSISLLVVIALGVLTMPSRSLGVMSSTNYTIFADSVDAGGVLSASGTFSLQDAVGVPGAGSSTSSVYEVVGGFQSTDWSALSVSTTVATVDLGTASASSVATSSAVISITADASDGYVLSIGSVSGSSLDAVSDGAVTAGSEEYGVAVSGVDAAFSDDRAVTAGRTLSSSSTPVNSLPITVTFKAAISSNSTAGSRSQSVTLSVSTNL